MEPVFSNAEENYIKAIFHLQKQSKSVSTNAVAGYMQTKPASVTDMLKKLQAKKLIDYKPYFGVKLTKTGALLALSIIRRHRLWEYFLVNKLGFEWDEVHEIAEQLEHVQHPGLAEKLDQYLKHPAFDPHGDPIPDMYGQMAKVSYLPLTEAEPGVAYLFASVGQQTPELMKMLRHKQVALGQVLQVKERFDFDQSMDVAVENGPLVSFSYRLAKYILVKAIDV